MIDEHDRYQRAEAEAVRELPPGQIDEARLEARIRELLARRPVRGADVKQLLRATRARQCTKL
jgi:hypothetical protein